MQIFKYIFFVIIAIVLALIAYVSGSCRLPTVVHGYLIGTITAISAVSDVFYGNLISRTNALSDLKVFDVDKYHNICDQACDFQQRLLSFWLFGKIAQGIGAISAILLINNFANNYILVCSLIGDTTLLLQCFVLFFITNTARKRDVEIWSILKSARTLENKIRLRENIESHSST